MRRILPFGFAVVLMATAVIGSDEEAPMPIQFASFAETVEAFDHCLTWAESIRAFGGSLKDAPIWIYVPEGKWQPEPEALERLKAARGELRRSAAPPESLEYYFARKVFAAAAAEEAAAGRAAVLAWMDEDTVILREPRELRLPEGVSLAYRPVMHQLIGSLHSEPPDEFWRRLYRKLDVPEERLFPMTTPADRRIIRPYFNAGLLAVRPERGILRAWAGDFPKLYQDAYFAEQCQEIRRRIFLHQTALVGAVLRTCQPGELLELPERYNYPLFFQRNFETDLEFNSIRDAVTIRYDIYFRKPDPDWPKMLDGPVEQIRWMKERLDPGPHPP